MESIERYNPIDKYECIEVFKSNMPELFWDQELLDFQNWISKNDCPDFYVLKKDEKIIGFGGFYRERRKAQLVYGVIHREYHNKGYGKQMMDFRVNKIREKDESLTITLEAKKSNYKYFEKLGFRIAEIIPYYFYSTIDKYEMVLPPQPASNNEEKTAAKTK